MNLYLALGGFLLIAVLWAIIMFSVLRVGFKVKKKSVIYILFIFIGLSVMIFLISAVIEYTESPEFCGTACHPRADLIVHDTPMESYYDGYENPDNNTIMSTHADEEVTCSNCHDAPGVLGKVQAYVAAIGELFTYISGSYDADHLEAHVPDEYCLKCHNDDHAEKPGTIISLNNISVDPHDGEKECADCHEPHQDGTGLSEAACTVCHEIDESALKSHGETTGKDCMACHDRKHPNDANIPISGIPELSNNEFCSDCHQIQFEGYINTWSVEKIVQYGNCTTICHSEHKEIAEIPIHKITSQPFKDDCNKCHVETVVSHKFYNISYSSYSTELDNRYCSNCHEPEFNTYTKYNTGNCTSCHTDHATKPISTHIIESPYDNCEDCHTDLKSKHDVTFVTFSKFPPTNISNEFCSACHSDEFDRLKAGSHSSRDCMQCHNEHDEIQVEFSNCNFCHADIPSQHNEYTTNCSGCHDLTKIHGT